MEMENPKNRKVILRVLLLFGALSWVHMLFMTWPFLRSGASDPGSNLFTLFHICSWLGYSFAYLLPLILPAVLIGVIWPRRPVTIYVFAVAGTCLGLMFVRADQVIFDMYGFHFNGFVWNLVTTSGGIESLGGGRDSYIMVGLLFLTILLIQTLLLIVGSLAVRRHWLNLRLRWGVAAVLIALLTSEVIYGVSEIRNDGAILDTAHVYPFYQKVRFHSVAAMLGIKTTRSEQVKVSTDTTRLNYPLDPIAFEKVDHPPNIVILVAESLRADRLSPEIMPQTWQFAQRGQRFTRHYSSGNGTREGLFGMFYGLYGSYWSSFLHSQKSPLLMDRLQELNYQFDLRTSARFSYPEFNKTIFAKVPLRDLHEDYGQHHPWERDELNATDLIRFLEQRDPSRPFFSFFFMESTHARYSFPDSAAIAKPYLEELNYAKMSRQALAPHIGQLLNRYTNAAHWIDQQLARIYAALEEQGLLDNTIVILTGDHGEEFLEKGFWGHNSSFVEEQIHVPMVVRMPHTGTSVIDQPTSHLDIATTLLQALGAPADPSDYSLGRNLFDATPPEFLVASDWHSISLITTNLKYRISYNSREFVRQQPTRPDDSVYPSGQADVILAGNSKLISQAIANCSKFSRRNANQPSPETTLTDPAARTARTVHRTHSSAE
jgi:membrane-anchored protein YejM (alkaline phosphatase superfamily)